MIISEHFYFTHALPMHSLPPLQLLEEGKGVEIRGIALLGFPLKGFLSFCDRLPTAAEVNQACCSTVLTTSELVSDLQLLFPNAEIVGTDDPRAIFIDVLDYLKLHALLKPSSFLPQHCTIAEDVQIAASAIIEQPVHIESGVRIGEGAVILAGTCLRAGVSIGENSVIGTVGINAYVGKDGKRRNFPHIASVVIDEGSTIGASAVVVRGILSSTQIGAHCIVGNLCNIGHGVEISDSVWMSVGTMVGGHSKIGDKATIAMNCSIRDNISIGANASLGMGSVVTKNVPTGRSVFGNPAKAVPSLKAGPER